MTLPPGYPVRPAPLHRPILFDQRWAALTFVHWPVRPDDVRHFFPPGTRPDVFADGLTYVALVPFEMRDAGPVGGLPVPYLGRFFETNVRLYSVDDAGRHGVLFRSLETQRLAVVALARLTLGIPYTWARMRMRREGATVRYESRRRWPQRGLRSELTVRLGPVVEPTPLEMWLTARWGAHSRVAGRTIWVPNEHAPWPLRVADIVELDDDLLAASGVRPCGAPLRALFSEGVRTRFGRPSLLLKTP